MLVAVGAFLIYDAVTLERASPRWIPLGPRFFPMVIGVILVVLAVILAIAIPRGSVGEADAGEDVDPERCRATGAPSACSSLCSSR